MLPMLHDSYFIEIVIAGYIHQSESLCYLCKITIQCNVKSKVDPTGKSGTCSELASNVLIYLNFLLASQGPKLYKLFCLHILEQKFDAKIESLNISLNRINCLKSLLKILQCLIVRQNCFIIFAGVRVGNHASYQDRWNAFSSAI